MAIDNRPDQTLEDVDAKEHRSKANWHAARVGNFKTKASLGKMIHHTYQAELLERGVKDSQGNQTPIKGTESKPKFDSVTNAKGHKVDMDEHGWPSGTSKFAFRD